MASVSAVINVTKRDGSRIPYDETKLRAYLVKASEGLENINIDSLIKSSKLSFINNIKTKDILNILINRATDCIDITTPDYQYLSARLQLNVIRRDVWNDWLPNNSLYDRVRDRVNRSIYDPIILNKYTKQEFHVIEQYVVNYDNDLLLTYSGVRQFLDKYLIKNRITSELYETPQEANILICMYMFMNYDSVCKDFVDKQQTLNTSGQHVDKQQTLTSSDKQQTLNIHEQHVDEQPSTNISEQHIMQTQRFKYISRMYNHLSHFRISLPTPIYAGVRTTVRSFSSCCVMDCGDTTRSILSTNYAIGECVTKRYGIGINVGKIRGIGSSINNGSVVHTGIVPFLKMFEASTKGFVQNGIRGGGGTISFPFWHWEVQTLLELKNNKGVVENRVRSLDYSIGLNRYFISKALKKEDIYLFSPEEVPLLSNDYTYTPSEFVNVYEQYVNDINVHRKQRINATDLLTKIATERYETGRIYIYFMDNMNNYGAFTESIFSSNLCQEIALPTKPFELLNSSGSGNNDNDNGLISVCILSSINVGRLTDTDNFTDLEEICDVIVRFLNEMIDYQTYHFYQLERSATQYRPLGIGMSDLFHLIAMKHLRYDTVECRNYIHKLSEAFQYYLLRASCSLAIERGKSCCEFDKSKYCYDILPMDRYKKTVDTVVNDIDPLTNEPRLYMDWKTLRNDIKRYGLYNTCLSAIAPTSSSSSISNSTPGIDPPRSEVTTKVSKYGTFKQIIPDYIKYKQWYTMSRHVNNTDYFKLIGVIQKWIDQGISTNSYYMSTDNVSIGDVVKEITTAFNYGLKTLYYLNSCKGVDEDIRKAFSVDGINETTKNAAYGDLHADDNYGGCAGGACSI